MNVIGSMSIQPLADIAGWATGDIEDMKRTFPSANSAS